MFQGAWGVLEPEATPRSREVMVGIDKNDQIIYRHFPPFISWPNYYRIWKETVIYVLCNSFSEDAISLCPCFFIRLYVLIIWWITYKNLKLHILCQEVLNVYNYINGICERYILLSKLRIWLIIPWIHFYVFNMIQFVPREILIKKFVHFDREEGDIGLFITLIPKVLLYIFLFVSWTTLETIIEIY